MHQKRVLHIVSFNTGVVVTAATPFMSVLYTCNYGNILLKQKIIYRREMKDDYYSAYTLSYDSKILRLKLVLESESLEEVIFDLPVLEEYMDAGAIKLFKLADMQCTSIALLFSEYGTYHYHERSNYIENGNIGIQKIYKAYDGRVIIVFKGFYISYIKRIYFEMDVYSKTTGYKFRIIDAYFDE